MIFNFFSILALVLISCAGAVEAAAPNTTELKADDGVNTRSFIAHEISSFLKRLGEGTFDFTDEERDIAYYKKGVAEEKAEIQSLFTLRVAAGKFFQAGNYLESLKKNINLFYKTRGQSYLCAMIEIARNAVLYDEATDLYMLSGLMLCVSSSPKLPNTNHQDLFRNACYKECFRQQNIDMLRQQTCLLPEFFSLIPKRYFQNAPLIMRKACLLFPESPNNIFYLGMLVHQRGLEIDEKGEFILPDQRNEVAARLYRQAKTGQSFYNLSHMLLAKQIRHDENNEHCKTDTEVYAATARLLQKSNDEWKDPLLRQAKTGQSFYNLSHMLLAKQIRHDENNEHCKTDTEVYAATARLLQKSNDEWKDPLLLYEFAYLIDMGFVDTDEKGKKLKDLSISGRHRTAARLLRELLKTERNANAMAYLAAMIFNRETDQDESGYKLTTDKAKIRAVERLCRQANTGQTRHLEALLCIKKQDIAGAITKTEQALEKGYTHALSLFYELKAQVETHSLEASADESEDDDIEADDEGTAAEVTEASSLHEPNASLLAYRVEQEQQAKSWKAHIFEQRRSKWQEKKAAAAFTYTPSLSQEKTIAEHWDKLAVNGRLKLAELWDQRIINLVDAIKAGDTRLGAPEMLDGDYNGWMSRRISRKHRLIYNFVNEMLVVKECGQHYRGR